jgi:ABC-type sugar transport system substrate-binding protein
MSMRMKMTRNAARAVLLVVCLASSAAFAQKATVLRVVVVKTDDPATYVQEIEKGRQLMKSLGIQGQTRVWQARFAGPEAGLVVVSIEYPSMVALADAYAKSNASSDYQAWLKGLDKIRKIVSDSLYSEW